MSPNVTFKDTLKKFINKYFSYLHGKSVENPYLTKSLILHFVILLLISGLLPTCSRKIEKPRVIAVDIMPMGDAQKTVPQTQPDEKKDEAKKEPTPQPPKEVKRPVEAAKMEKAEKPKPVAKPEEKKPSPKKVEKKPQPEKKKEEQKKKDDKDQEGKKKLLKDLEKKDQATLDNIFDKATDDQPKPSSQQAQSSGKSEAVDPAFINELMGKIQSQISQCWNIPIGAKDVQNMQVRLYIALTAQGDVTDVKILDQAQYATDNAYRVVADSALWAVKECSPLQGLPLDKYDLWKEIEFTFDPSAAL